MDPCFNYWLLSILKSFLNGLDLILDVLFGFTIQRGSRQERQSAKSDYEKCGQILRILHRASYHEFALDTLKNFIYTHEAYVNPKIAIQNGGKITLMGFDSTHAIFVISDQDLENGRKFPFLVLAQSRNAQKLLIMPIWAFLRLSNEIEMTRETFHIHMTARCGSTLIGQLMTSGVKATLVHFEPMCFNYVEVFRNKNVFNEEMLKKLTESCFRILTRKRNGIHRIGIKWNPFGTGQLIHLKSAFPNTKLIFNTRNFAAGISSLRKTMLSLPIFYLISGLLDQNNANQTSWYILDPKYKQKFGARHASFACWYLTFFQHKNLYEHFILYEDLLEDPKKAILDLWDALEIPQDQRDIVKAMDTMALDSQNGVLVKRGQNKNSITPNKNLIRLEKEFEEMGMKLKINQSLDDLRDCLKIK